MDREKVIVNAGPLADSVDRERQRMRLALLFTNYTCRYQAGVHPAQVAAQVAAAEARAKAGSSPARKIYRFALYHTVCS